MQGINDSVDALRTRIDKLSAQLQAIQSQLQNINTQAAVQQQAPGSRDSREPIRTRRRSSTAAAAGAAGEANCTRARCADYNSARYDLAAGEFGDVLKYYPQDDLAGNAQFYLGEIAYRQGKYADAIKAYGVVLQQFAGNSKAPAAAAAQGRGGAVRWTSGTTAFAICGR